MSETRLEELHIQIDEAQHRVTDLNNQIADVSSEILAFKNANDLFIKIPAPHLRHKRTDEESSKLVSELDQEHLELIRIRKDRVSELKKQINEINREKDILQPKFNDEVEAEKQIQAEILQITESIKLLNAECLRVKSETNYVQDQITERTKEVKFMSEMKREVEQQYSALLTREESYEVQDGGKLDYEMIISNLQNDIRIAEEEIYQLQTVIEQNSGYIEMDQKDKEQIAQQYQENVKWDQEKEELKTELKELQEEIRRRKQQVASSESRSSHKQECLRRYIPLVNKWKNKFGDMPIPEKSIGQLWIELNEAKKKLELDLKRSQEEIAELVNSNQQLSENVRRRRVALERIVTQFHEDEKRVQQRIDDSKMKSEAEEAKLLKQIEAAKLRIGQKVINSC